MHLFDVVDTLDVKKNTNKKNNFVFFNFADFFKKLLTLPSFSTFGPLPN